MRYPKHFFVMLATPEGALMPHKLVRGVATCAHMTSGPGGWQLMAVIQWAHIDTYLTLLGVDKNDRDYFTGRIDFPQYLWNLNGPMLETQDEALNRLTDSLKQHNARDG